MSKLDIMILAHDHTEYRRGFSLYLDDGTTCINCSSHGVSERKMHEWLARAYRVLMLVRENVVVNWRKQGKLL